MKKLSKKAHKKRSAFFSDLGKEWIELNGLSQEELRKRFYWRIGELELRVAELEKKIK